jgi:hypothetical protein
MRGGDTARADARILGMANDRTTRRHAYDPRTGGRQLASEVFETADEPADGFALVALVEVVGAEVAVFDPGRADRSPSRGPPITLLRRGWSCARWRICTFMSRILCDDSKRAFHIPFATMLYKASP